MIRTETKHLPLKARQTLGKQTLWRDKPHGQGMESREWNNWGGEAWHWGVLESVGFSMSRQQKGLAAGDEISHLEKSVQGQTSKSKAELLLRKSWNLDQKVRQRLRTRENRAKTQPLWQKYKTEVRWEDGAKGSFLEMKAKIGTGWLHWEVVDAQQPNSDLAFIYLFLISRVGRGLQPGTGLSENKILILLVGMLRLFSCQVMSDSCFSVPHYLPEFADVHVQWINDAIQPSHPLSPSSPPAFNLSQHQGLFQWVSCSHQMAKELELQLVGTSCSCILYAGYISIFVLIYLTLNSTYYISGIFSTHHKY